MTKKDYERAATLIQSDRWVQAKVRVFLIDAFATFFTHDNPRFDEDRFRAACVPGANVRARPRKAGA